MTQELLYTSAPRGLKPGIKGFCTVASTAGMSAPLAERLESLSGYRHLYPPHDKEARLNPIQYSHLVIKLGGQALHVLSRVCDAGLDYSQRSNKLAHHVTLTDAELVPAGPAWLLSSPGFMETSFVGEPRILPAGRQAPQGTSPPRVCRAWEAASGDAGWAGVLAETAVEGTPKVVNIIYPVGAHILSLVEEAMALLPAARRWAVTFSTYYTKLPPGIDCHWRFLVDGEAEAKTARRSPQIPLIDLCSQLGPAEGGPLVSAARTGHVPEPAVAEAAAAPVMYERSFRNTEPSFASDAGRAASASSISSRQAAAPAARQAPPQLWPTLNPSLDGPPRQRNTKRILIAAGKAFGVVLLVAGAFALGEFHGRQSTEPPSPTPAVDTVAMADAAKPRPPEVPKEKKSPADAAKDTKPPDGQSGGKDEHPDRAPPQQREEESGRKTVAASGGDYAEEKPPDSAERKTGKPRSVTHGGDQQPEEFDFKAYRKELEAIRSSGPLKLGPLDEPPKDISLKVPVCPGADLTLDCERAKLWDPDVDIHIDWDNRKGRVLRNRPGAEPHDVGLFSVKGDTLHFRWSTSPQPMENLTDCFLVVTAGGMSQAVRLPFRPPTPPVTVQLGFDGKNRPDASARLRTDERAWPAHRPVHLTTKLHSDFSISSQLGIRGDTSLDIEPQKPAFIYLIYRAPKQTDSSELSTTRAIQVSLEFSKRDKVFVFKAKMKLLSNTTLGEANESDWQPTPPEKARATARGELNKTITPRLVALEGERRSSDADQKEIEQLRKRKQALDDKIEFLGNVSSIAELLVIGVELTESKD